VGAGRTEHDVIIVGGGVNGTGIARDAALRGMRVLVVEKNDLAKGASGANTGMIHGGIRYLRYDVKTTKVACTDSGYIQRIAPHLLFRIPFLFPVFEGDVFGRFLLEGAEIFFEAYDVYQPLKRGKAHTRLSRKDVLALEPGFADDVIGAVTMDEWGIDPFRLVVANALDAEANNGIVRTWCELDEFVRGPGGEIQGVVFTDRLSGARETHSAPLVINATGAWGPRIAAKAGAHYRVRPGKGVHIVYSHRISNFGVVMMAVDGRQMFLMPHENGTIVGTTDDDYYGDLDNPHATEDEVRYILQAARRVLPGIDRYRTSRTYVGIRPTLYEWGKTEDRLSREHEFYDHANDGAAGLVSVAGGKLAAYRQLSEEVTDLIAKRVGNTTPCTSHTSPLPGAEGEVDVVKWAESFARPRLAVARMAYRHGSRAKDVLAIVGDDPRTGVSTCVCEPVTEAEIRYTCRNEIVRRLVDVRRRTRTSMGACGGTRCLYRASQLLAEEIGLSAPQTLREWRDATTGRFIGKRPVLEGANLATEEMSQAMHYLSGNLRPFLLAAQAGADEAAWHARHAPAHAPLWKPAVGRHLEDHPAAPRGLLPAEGHGEEEKQHPPSVDSQTESPSRLEGVMPEPR
jgi:glycerol-3-phosphate dehydrogenase